MVPCLGKHFLSEPSTPKIKTAYFLPCFRLLVLSYVNHLDESDFEKKETIGILRQLRLNVCTCVTAPGSILTCLAIQLKLAIDNSLLPESDPSLLSSYLQVLIMSEGDVWLHKAVHEVSLAIRLSPYIMGTVLDSSAGPVHRADSMVRDFCTKELRSVQGGTFGVEAYIANAVMDLVIMATWSLIIEQIPEAEPLPVSSKRSHVNALLITKLPRSRHTALRETKGHTPYS